MAGLEKILPIFLTCVPNLLSTFWVTTPRIDKMPCHSLIKPLVITVNVSHVYVRSCLWGLRYKWAVVCQASSKPRLQACYTRGFCWLPSDRRETELQCMVEEVVCNLHVVYSFPSVSDFVSSGYCSKSVHGKQFLSFSCMMWAFVCSF